MKQRLPSTSNLDKLSKVFGGVDYSKLPDNEKEAVIELLEYIQQTGDLSILDTLVEEDYYKTPVTPQEFLKSDYFLGSFADSLYPTWKEELEHVLTPSNGITEWVIYGSIGTGKCVSASTLVPCSRGLLTIEEIYSDTSVRQVLSESGMRDLTYCHNEGMTATKRVRTVAGRQIEGRPNHRVRVLTSDLAVAWKKLEDVSQGDRLLVSSSTSFPVQELPSLVAEGIGWITSRGSCNYNEEEMYTSISIIVTDDDKNHVLKCLHEVKRQFGFGSVDAVYVGSNSYRIEWSWGVELLSKAQEVFPFAKSDDKEIPKVIRSNGVKTWKGFLRGLFYGKDIEKGNIAQNFIFTTVSSSLAYQVAVMLTALGLHPTTQEYVAKGIWDVQVSSNPLYKETVGDKEIVIDIVTSVEDSKAHCYDLTVKDDPSYVSGGFISHNTTAACCAQLYKLHILTCMKSPQKLFGLAPNFPIYISFFSTTKGKAEDAINSKFQSMLNMSPYFRESLPKNPRKVFLTGGASIFGPGYKEHPKKDDLFELVLPHNVHLLFGSQTGHALSLDIFAAVLDEMNFRGKKSIKEEEDENSARALYDHVRTRIASRFASASDMPGLVINISSAKAQDSFVEQRITQIRENQDRSAHISDFALWDVKPGKYSSDTFKVFVGSGYRASRILAEGEEIPDVRRDETIIDVPENFRSLFEENLANAIRDIAGVATAGINSLFTRPEVLMEAEGDYPNAIYPEILEVGIDNDVEIADHFDLDLVSNYDNIRRHLANFPGVDRFIHVDLALNADRASITSTCLPYYFKRYIENEDDPAKKVVQHLPFVYVDFFCCVKAPNMDEISFEKIRQFLIWLRNVAGYPVRRITYDSWQSIHSMQLLKGDGFDAEALSVDRTDEPYMELLSAYNEHRIVQPKYALVHQELRKLKHDIRAAKGRVDHPPGGSKDVADSLAGSLFNALKFLHEHGFAGIGSELVTEKLIKDLFKSKSDKKAQKIAKELELKEPVHLPKGYDGQFYGRSRFGI